MVATRFEPSSKSSCRLDDTRSTAESRETAVDVQRLIANATALTVDSARRSATAFAIDGERISAVGRTEVLLAQRTPNTEVVDLGGRTVVPGFIDAHSHFGPLTLSGQDVAGGGRAQRMSRPTQATSPGWLA